MKNYFKEAGLKYYLRQSSATLQSVADLFFHFPFSISVIISFIYRTIVFLYLCLVLGGIPPSIPVISPWLAPYLPPIFIGISSEPHRNLIGTSSGFHRDFTMSSANHLRIYNMLSSPNHSKHFACI